MSSVNDKVLLIDRKGVGKRKTASKLPRSLLCSSEKS
jgi:hypothetical protein